MCLFFHLSNFRLLGMRHFMVLRVVSGHSRVLILAVSLPVVHVLCIFFNVAQLPTPALLAPVAGALTWETGAVNAEALDDCSGVGVIMQLLKLTFLMLILKLLDSGISLTTNGEARHVYTRRKSELLLSGIHELSLVILHFHQVLRCIRLLLVVELEDESDGGASGRISGYADGLLGELEGARGWI